MAEVRALEHPTLKVPYEVLNKRFRTAQKTIDREVSHVQDMLVGGQTSSSPPGSSIKPLEGLADKLSALRSKLQAEGSAVVDAASACRRRLNHLKNQSNQQQWKKQRLDRMLVDHFLRCGYYEAAVKLASRSDVDDLTNLRLFLVSRDIEDSLRRKETGPCLTWCHDNKSKLRKLRSSLEFDIRRQEFVELVRTDQRNEAVKHARKYFSTAEGEEQLAQVRRCMGLLAFPADTTLPPYRALLSPDRWDSLALQFRNDHFKLYQLGGASVFSVALQAGLSALKTPLCYREGGRNPDCPACSPALNALARPLPYAHCAQSRLVCALSGEPLNEHNHPLALPNGHVYGETALRSMAAQNDGKVTCPRTKAVYHIREAEKIFVM